MFRVAPMGADSFALAIWDPTWNSYNNCYLTTKDKVGLSLIAASRLTRPNLRQRSTRWGFSRRTLPRSS